MNLKYAIQKKFPKSHASQFLVWDENSNKLFDYASYSSGNYDKRLLDKVVIEVSEATVLYSGMTTLHITVDTGVKQMKELIEAAITIKNHCDISKCSSETCPFWKDICMLQNVIPSGWNLSKGV